MSYGIGFPDAGISCLWDLQISFLYNTGRIPIIKLMKERFGYDFAEASKVLRNFPVIVNEGMTPDQAEEMKVLFKQAGASVDLILNIEMKRQLLLEVIDDLG